MIQFDGTIIPGFHGEMVAECPEVPKKSRYPWGLRGNVLIIGKQAKRNITCEIWLNDPKWETPSEFYTGLKQLEDLVGIHGTLNSQGDFLYGVWEVPATQTFLNCFFAGYELLTFRGQEVSAPVQDEGACLYANSTDQSVQENKSWAQRMRLKWIQTSVDRLVLP